MPGEEFVNTSWVNHFDVQDTDIGNLDNELYQFKTVGKNPLGESPPSDITEARPLPGVAGMFSPPPPLPPPSAPVIHPSLCFTGKEGKTTFSRQPDLTVLIPEMVCSLQLGF